MGAAFPGPGQVLADRYEIVRELGRGGYSVVYLAKDRTLEVDVALKLLVPPPAERDEARERMRREAQAVRSMVHPNVVALHDFVESGDHRFLVMEYVDGADLGALVETGGPLPAARVIEVGTDIARALAEAHDRGILHRDVKPRNVLVDSDGRARLTDFGSARLEGQTTMTHTGGVVGSLAYAAPEVLAGGRGDGRSDVYALGLTLFFALAGALPPERGPLGLNSNDDGFRPSVLGVELPTWLDDVVARATRAEPRHRFATADALRRALSGGESELAPHPGDGRCLVCRGPASDEVGLCPACAATGPGEPGDALVFLAGRPARGDRRARIRSVEAMLGEGISDVDARAAAIGLRPLLRAPRAVASRAAEAFRREGLPATAEPPVAAAHRIPRSYTLLVAAGLAVGVAAGAAGSTLVGVSSPLVAALLWLAAFERIRRPLVRVEARPSALPAPAEAGAVAAIASLPDGTASDLLAELLRVARRLASDPGFESLDPGGRTTADVIAAAVALARDLDRLDGALAAMRETSTRGNLDATRDAVAGAERARDRLVQRLLAGTAALGRAQASLAAGRSTDSAVEDAVAELERDVRAHAEAAAEVEALLSSRIPTGPRSPA